jgi:hypothetical protein
MLHNSYDLNDQASLFLIRAIWHMHCGDFRKAANELDLLDDENLAGVGYSEQNSIKQYAACGANCRLYSSTTHVPRATLC